MDWLEIKEFIKDTAKIGIVAVVILVVVVYIVSITQVVGSSMYPTLKDGEILILNKLKYKVTDVKRGDIISLKYADTKYLIKRVIGMPGDEVYIKDNQLYINNKVYKEPYIKEMLKYDNFDLSTFGYDKIPDGYYFVLGDNRENSLDSREIGLIPKKDIIGKVSIRFWPLNKFKFM